MQIGWMEKNEKQAKNEEIQIWRAKLKYLTVDSDNKMIIENHIGTIDCNWSQMSKI